MRISIEWPDACASLVIHGTPAGPKTQVRKTINPQPCLSLSHDHWVAALDAFHDEAFTGTRAEGLGRKGSRKTIWYSADWCDNLIGEYGPCPFGKPKDILVDEKHGIEREISSVRIERICDISMTDVLASGTWVEPPPGAVEQTFPEGMDRWTEKRRTEWFAASARAMYVAQAFHGADLFKAFKARWQAHNMTPWSANPWVWVVTFTHSEDDRWALL